MTPKLIAADLDGTLLTPESKISPRTAATITQCREAGHLFIFATGRPLRNTADYAKALSPDGIVANNGGFAQFRGEVILSLEVEREHSAGIIKELLSSGLYFEADFGTYGLTNHPDYQSWGNWGYYTDYSDFSDFSGPGIQKLAVESLDYKTLAKTLDCGKFGCRFVPSYAGSWHMIMPKDADKAHGVRAVCGRAGMDMADVICFGDDSNDLGMLQECGMGVAMGNAGDVVKGAAKEVTLTNAEDGVARWLEENLL